MRCSSLGPALELEPSLLATTSSDRSPCSCWTRHPWKTPFGFHQCLSVAVEGGSDGVGTATPGQLGASAGPRQAHSEADGLARGLAHRLHVVRHAAAAVLARHVTGGGNRGGAEHGVPAALRVRHAHARRGDRAGRRVAILGEGAEAVLAGLRGRGERAQGHGHVLAGLQVHLGRRRVLQECVVFLATCSWDARLCQPFAHGGGEREHERHKQSLVRHCSFYVA
mmetsp:Transcript_143286/g.399444  ORF Transcript_143286/g.399444 Transcript_143286/m.399444 type:complete len:224 (-) Transcript_143286:38-709(-)